MSVALLRLTRRYIVRRRIQSLLFVAGIALGVAVGVAIDIANSSAERAFSLSVNTVTGRTTHQVVGASGTVPTSVYERIRGELGIRSSAPVVDVYVQAAALDNRTLHLLGVDPLAEAPFRDYLMPAQEQSLGAPAAESLFRLMTEPNTILMSAELGRIYGVTEGDEIVLQTPTRSAVTVQVVGFITSGDETRQEALRDLVIADIATAQEIAGVPGRMTRVDLILPPDYPLETIRQALPSGVVLVDAAAQNSALAQMSEAFSLNLRALSLLALLVGVFLIYNTVMFSVVQRRHMIGVLRSLGTTRRQVIVMILGEAVLLGAIGSVLGVGLGVILGQGAVDAVSQTVTDLYFRVSVSEITVEVDTLVKGLAIGAAASLTAALVPAIEATRTDPVGVLRRSAIESGTLRLLPYVVLFAVALIAAGIVVLQFPSESITLSFVSLFMILIGCALLTPGALVIAMWLAAPVSRIFFGVVGRIAPRAVVRSLSRTSIAVAALTLAVSAIVGVSVMIGSFRGTVVEWLDLTLGADIFISMPSDGRGGIEPDVDPRLADTLQQVAGVERVITVRNVQVIAPDYPDLPPVNLSAPDGIITKGPRRFAWSSLPSAEDYWQALESGAVVVSEPFAYHRDITPENNQLTLLTDQGPQTFEVVGVYYDYTTDQGTVQMAQAIYRQYYDDPYVSALALDLSPTADLETVLGQLRAGPLNGTGLTAQSNRALRESALEVFDRTFAITVALRLLATIVAFIGVLSALLALQLENVRQFGIMRANGMTPGQLRLLTFIQTGLMGFTSGVLALPIGIVLAVVLIEVINVRSFGWSMALQISLGDFVLAIGVALGAALLAGIYPALKLSRLSAIQALRSE